MIDSLLAEAWINKKHKVFGKRLRPYCLWHEFLLLASENPLFCKGEEDATFLHLEIATRICRIKYPKIPSFKVHPIRMIFRSKKVLVREVVKFETYIRDYNSGPDFWRKDDGPKNGGPPGTLLTLHSCMAAGFSEQEAWGLPIGQALWHSAIHQFDKGAELDFVTERSRRMMAELKERLKKDGQEKCQR